MSGIKVVDEISTNTRNSSGSRSGASTRYNSAIVDSISITNRSTKSVKKHYIEIIVPKLLRDSENDNSIYPPKRIQSSPSHRAETIHNRQRRFSQDSTLTGFDVSKQRRFSVQPSSFSLDNLRRAEFSDNCNNLPMKSIFTHDDDIIESPLLKTTEDNWTTTDVPQTINQQPSHLINETDNDAFGPKVSNEHIPGTPMERQDTITQANSIINDINNYQRLNERSGPSTPRKNSDGSIYTTNSDQSSTASHLQFKKTDKRNSIPALNGENLIGRRVSKQDKEGLDPESLMFRDNRRKIDMVLAFEEESEGVMTETEARRRDQRRIFQENLIKEGLELEIEDRFQSFDEKTYFIKIHMPWRTEVRLAEVLNLKLPVKRFITISVKAWDDEKVIGKAVKLYMKWKKKFSKWISLDPSYIEEEPSFYNATAGGNPEEQFIVKDRASTYTSAQRSLIVMQILLRTKYDETEKCGIRRLLNDGTFMACFPLHEGRYDKPHSSGAIYDRRLLYLQWARPAKWYKKQPLNLIRKYFGDKIGLYFCWLGFYTQMLIYPAIVGTLCFIYGLATMESEDNTPSKEICDTMGAGNTTLCPMCDKGCSYTRLSESCPFARLTYLFDNPSTVFFAIFMSFWATTFLELWKRKQSVIIWEWDLQNVEADQEARPEFETSVKTFRINPVTREREPYMPTWTRAIKFAITGSAVFFMICVVLSAVLGTIIYRLSVYSLIYSGSHQWLRQEAKVFTIITAAIINLTVIMILTRIYHRLAIYLTNLENPRTQTEYEDSYTFKIFFFEFMNFYSSLIYIAFFKGRFYDYPGDDVSRENSFYRLKADICDPAGCLSELCIQLAIIMIGKQCWNNFMEYLFPKFWNWWRLRKHKAQTKDESHLHMTWEQDYHMQDPGRLALFDEYLEMILQYGFLTLFVAAFPLAPLFALLNNIAEIRLDAFKMVTQARRPLAERVEDIGAWFGILRIITYASVVTNAFVIAYTSDFIPRMVYKYVYSRDSTLSGYIQHSLSPFSTKYVIEKFGIWNETDPKLCYYRGYRNGEEENYSLQSHYWHVFAARLAFVVIFEHVVFTITGIMRFLIPDIPAEVKTQIQREQLLAKEAKYQHGLKKSQDGEYQDLLQMIREQNTSINSSRQGGVRGNWARRFSRISDGIDSQLDGHVVNRPKRSINSTVWEVT